MCSMSSGNFKSWKEKAIRNAFISGEDSDIINLHVLVNCDEEKNIYNAHALEFDIIGEGIGKREALKEVLESVMNQISFCTAYDNRDKIVHPAPDKYWLRFFDGAEKNAAKQVRRLPKLDSRDTMMPFRQITTDEVCLVNG